MREQHGKENTSGARIVYGRLCAISNTLVRVEMPIPSEDSTNLPVVLICGRYGLPVQNGCAEVVFAP
jgi:hypothetical protein